MPVVKRGKLKLNKQQFNLYLKNHMDGKERGIVGLGYSVAQGKGEIQQESLTFLTLARFPDFGFGYFLGLTDSW